MNRIIAFIMMCVLCASMNICAQSNSAADKLYQQAMTYMKTKTVAMQKKAIASFEKAKVAYDSKSKKELCDQQIQTCNNTIKKLSAPKQESPVEESPKEEEVITPVPVVKETKEIEKEVTLSVNPASVELSAKGGKYIEVSVSCSEEGWKIESCPDWISYEVASSRILIVATKNTIKAERAGIISITCKNKRADIVVKQAKAGFFGAL